MLILSAQLVANEKNSKRSDFANTISTDLSVQNKKILLAKSNSGIKKSHMKLISNERSTPAFDFVGFFVLETPLTVLTKFNNNTFNKRSHPLQIAKTKWKILMYKL